MEKELEMPFGLTDDDVVKPEWKELNKAIHYVIKVGDFYVNEFEEDHTPEFTKEIERALIFNENGYRIRRKSDPVNGKIIRVTRLIEEEV